MGVGVLLEYNVGELSFGLVLKMLNVGQFFLCVSFNVTYVQCTYNFFTHYGHYFDWYLKRVMCCYTCGVQWNLS